MVSVEVDSGPINNSNNFSTPSTLKESQKKIFDKERSISPSCAEYIKKKEMFLYKMMNDGSNKAMLYFLEILMQSKIPISIEDLANRLAHKSFSEDMKKACGGGSVEGLKSFFLKYPSLFNVRKDGLVSSIDLDTQSIENEVVSSENGAESTTKKEEKKKSEKIYVSPAFRGEKVCCTNQGDVSISSTSGNQTAPSSTCCHCTNVNVNNFITASHDNIAKETEAVRFFQQRLIRREEKWVQIKSLAGHLSQANQEIRNLVGPQLEFKNFLLKHPQVFEIQGELVSLREIIPANSKKVKIQSKTSKTTTSGPNRRPKSLIMMTSDVQLRNNSSRPMMQAEMEINRRHSLSSAPVTPTLTGKSGQVVQCISTEGLCLSMSANEYRAVMYLRKVLEKKSVLTLSKLMQYLSIKAPEAIQNIIGWTRIELEEFISQHDIFFEMRAGGLFSSDSMSLKAQSCVSTSTNSSSGISSGQSNNNLGSNGSMIITNKKFHQTVNILITTGKKTEGSNRTLNNKSGRICHVAKLWGIIDLGKHEHVFFDKSLFRYVDDLQKHFQINELLYFNAILAPKESRAKWRAIQVWKECDRENLERMSGPISSHIIGDKLRNNSENMKSYQTEHHQEIYDMLNNAGCQSSIGDDTEFEGEMDDYDLMPLEHTNSRLDDILTSEVEDQINAILGPAKPNYRKINDYLTVTDEVWGLGTEEDLSYCGTISSELSNNASSQLNLGNDGQVTSTYIHEPLDESISTQKNSIGCQTLATGDIMASQLFHESMSKLV